MNGRSEPTKGFRFKLISAAFTCYSSAAGLMELSLSPGSYPVLVTFKRRGLALTSLACPCCLTLSFRDSRSSAIPVCRNRRRWLYNHPYPAVEKNDVQKHWLVLLLLSILIRADSFFEYSIL